MASVTLTKNDLNVLERIKDPEAALTSTILIDSSLARDPHITDKEAYEQLVQREREILLPVQHVELQLTGLQPKTTSSPEESYRQCVERLDELVDEFSDYASARNNRAQALRRLYGDNMLVPGSEATGAALIRSADESERAAAANQVLSDLDRAISLLSPANPFTAISPQAAKTLSLAHTQRAAIYHATAKLFSARALRSDGSRKEAKWSKLQFEEAASRDFAFGGRYGCEVAKGLAVSTNPTAKLCGQMVREAMREEYGSTFVA